MVEKVILGGLTGQLYPVCCQNVASGCFAVVAAAVVVDGVVVAAVVVSPIVVGVVVMVEDAVDADVA